MIFEPRPEISIITPSLDQAAFLERAIESVAAQSGVRTEHIVIDGGSSDGTLAILQRRSREGLRWISEPDRGQSHAFNKGLRVASADVVGWLNADDEYAPGALRSAVELLQTRPDLDVVHGHVDEIDEAGWVRRRLPARGFDLRSLLLQRFTLYHPSFFYRREALDGIGPVDEDLQLVMDFDLALRIARSCRVGRIDTVLARHRVHPGAKSARWSAGFTSEYLRVLDRFFADPALPAHVASLRPAAYQAVHLEGGVRALRTGDRHQATASLSRSLRSGAPLGVRTVKALLLLIDASAGIGIGRALVRALGGQV